jgi:Met-zincin
MAPFLDNRTERRRSRRREGGVGDADAVASSALGMKNLQRVGKMLLSATSTQKGEPYDDLQEVYGRLLGQWVLEMNHVAAIVGGFDSQQKHIGQEGVLFTPVSRERQLAAVRFLHENAFRVPAFAVNPEILRRIEPVGVLDRVKTSQTRVLTTLLDNARIGRLIEQEAIDSGAAYRPTDFFADVRKGIWSELTAPQVKIDAYRRNLQRSYLDTLNEKLNGRTPVNNDSRAFMRGELTTLKATIVAALAKAPDRATQFHLLDARDQISKILDPRFERPAQGGASPQAPGNGFEDNDDAVMNPEICFPDYAIRLVR